MVRMWFLLSQGFLDMNFTEFQKSGANITGFQLMNYSDENVNKAIEEWVDFDSKDLKLPKRRLKVWSNCLGDLSIYVLKVSINIYQPLMLPRRTCPLSTQEPSHTTEWASWQPPFRTSGSSVLTSPGEATLASVWPTHQLPGARVSTSREPYSR